MKIKNVNIEYYVMYHDFNKNTIKRINIFNNELIEIIAKNIRSKKIQNLADLQEWLKHEFMYHYWSKSEYEIAVGGLFSKHPSEFQKLDVWYQIEKNLPMLTNYVNYQMDLKLN